MMATTSPISGPSSPASYTMNAHSFPNPDIAASDAGGDGASVLSSRMTDIATDDGHDRAPAMLLTTRRGDSGGTSPVSPTSPISPTSPTSPVSFASRSAVSSTTRPGWATTSRRALAPRSSQRSKASATGSMASGRSRPESASSRSHVPSLTSNAFYHPMSSQRLQAQRAVARSALQTTGSEAASSDLMRNGSVNSTHTLRNPVRGMAAELETLPPSRGTEMTEQNTLNRTANTSPVNDLHATGSTSDSVRPLQKNTANTKGLSLNIDKSYKTGAASPLPTKSPHSFRSTFLLPARGDVAPTSPGRSTHGAEKLSSSASSAGLSRAEMAKHSAAPHLGSNYEYFQGNTIFCAGGRAQNSRSRPVNIATGIFIVIPAVLFFVFSASWLWHHSSPAIPILFGYIFYICFSSFVHASVSDPGILPRNLHPMPPPDEDEDPLRLGPALNDWTMIKSASSSTAAMEVPTKYCKTCNIWRPPRGHHCRVCDNCIESHDHHCVWLNNCVGRRNYRYFFTFVIAATLLGLFLIGASLGQVLVYMTTQDVSFRDAINHFPVPFAMVIYGAFATPYPAALTFYHIFLMGRGETTREYLNSHKFPKKDRHRPFTQASIYKNLVAILCKPRSPTYLHFKRRYEEGDQRFGARRGRKAAKEGEGGMGDSALEMQDVQNKESAFRTTVGSNGLIPR